MFDHMQALPIRYFDTHTHGDIMSYYTNDIDTLRQMLSQSMPQMFSSAVTIVTVFFAMLYTNATAHGVGAGLRGGHAVCLAQDCGQEQHVLHPAATVAGQVPTAISRR